MRLSVRQIHYLVMIFLAVAFAFLQSHVFGMAPWSIFHIDFVTILVVYMAVEHPLFDALVRALVAATVLASLSAAPSGFFLMYYVQVLVLAAIVSKRLVLWGRASQVALFVALLVLKHGLFAVLVISQGRSIDFLKFVWSVLPTVFSTSLVALPCFRVFSALDLFFEVRRGREENGYSLT